MILAGAALCLLAGCDMVPAATKATVSKATVSKAQADLQTAIDLYGVAKGIAEVAGLVNPGVGVAIAGLAAAVDPVVARAQTALNDATTDAAAIEALSGEITAQANAITVRAGR